VWLQGGHEHFLAAKGRKGRAYAQPAESWYVDVLHDTRAELTFLDDVLDDLIAQSKDFTVIYITTPLSEEMAKAQLDEQHPPYEMENPFGEYQQIELKRDLSSHAQRANSTNAGGLFERYQYFTPGLFMGFAAIVPLFLILLVGIRALTSLEVSYFAFSKEMGPNAVRKQQ
jgi:hypothetical protein